MSNVLKTVLLIDDNEATNMLHERIIKKAAVTENVVVKTNGKNGIDYINECLNNGVDLPELILLDINMPVMNGWEFLQEYERVTSSVDDSNRNVVVMLTTSLNPKDMERSKSFRSVSKYLGKPLSLIHI